MLQKKSSNTLNIIYYASIDLAESNASFLHVMGVSNGLARLGYPVTLILPKPEKVMYLENFYHPNLHIIFHSRLIKRPRFLNNLFALPQLIQTFRKNKKATLYIRMSLLSWLPILVARLFKLKVITEHNGWLKEEVELLGVPNYLSFIMAYIQKKDAQLAHRTRTVTELLKERLIGEGVRSEKIFTAGNATSLQLFFPISREEALKQLNLDPHLFYLGFIGALSQWQGVHYAIDAMPKLIERFPNLHLLIAGSGMELNHLQDHARALNITEKITFMGNISIEKANLVINAFDIALSPGTAFLNQKTGVSKLKIRDYAAAGRAMIIAALPGQKELADEHILMTHEPDNVDDLAEKVTQLIQDSSLRLSLQQNARAYAEKYFDWIHTCRRISEEMNTL